jgi:hypothetical protein
MRRVIVGLAVAVLVSSTAIAKEYIVVSSNDAGVRTGQSFDAGARVPLGAGRSLTLMKVSGEVVTVQGGPGGAVLPGDPGTGDNPKFAAVQALFAPPPSGRTYGAQRGFCPGPEVLDNIDAIIRSDQAGCKSDARKAFQDYLKAHGVSQADADKLYETTVVGSEGDAAH